MQRLRDFIIATTATLRQGQPEETQVLAALGPLLARLVASDDWLPDELAAPHPLHYQQYLLHADPQGLFSVVSFVWGPGQATPVHDHTVWGLIGMLRGRELSQAYAYDPEGRLQPQGEAVSLNPGQVQAVSPRLGDIHRVANAHGDRVSISIHVYGANIGTVQRHVYAEDGRRKPFVSGYANAWLPNPWGSSSAPGAVP
jgi:predicted metal-dependent enzyme (double-stranded beta helix superfamily)